MRALGQQKILANIANSSFLPVLQDASSRRPTMTLEAAKGALDCDEDEVIALIGTWLIGWDISTPGSGRREWRILTRSVSLGAIFLGRDERPPQWVWGDVLGLVFLPLITPRFWMTGVEVQHSLNCSSTHVMRLIECEALKLLPGTTYGKGRGRSPFVTCESFAQFLRARLEDSRNIVLPNESDATVLLEK